ncbi:MAG: ATP-binding protein [Thermoplasmata archaeon]
MAADSEPGRAFVGRIETVEALRRRFEDARAGTGGVTLLIGDTGVGKSILVADLVRVIRSRGTRLLVGRALPLDDPPPFLLIRAALDSAHDGDAGTSSADARPLGGDQVLIGFAPGLGGEEFTAPVSVETRLLEALGGTATPSDTSREKVLTGIANQFLEFTRHGPTVVILEDLHHADEPSLAAVEFLANQLKNEPLWILATSRPHAALSDSGRARLEGFEGATQARRIVLRPMTAGEVGEYLRQNEPSREFSAAEVARRYSETGGNPLLLQQFDHRFVAGVEAPEAPATELPRLDEEAQRTLDVAAVLGPEFTFALLLRASGEEDEERLAETVDRLVGEGLLLERPGELLAFPDDRLREAAYDLLTESRRRLLHWSVGETLEAMGSGGLATIYALARHFYLGRAGEKSVKYNRLAADIAERALAPEVAREHLARALESQRGLRSKDRDADSELVLELARITEELGHLKESEGILRDFLERERGSLRLSAPRRATLEIFLARVLADEGNMPASSELAKKILAAPGLDDQLLVRVGAHHQLGQALYYEGHYDEAVAHHTTEIELARQVGNPQVLLRAQVWRVAALAMMGQTEQAIVGAREVTQARDRLGSVRESAQAHLFFGDLLSDARSTPAQRTEALEEYAEAIRFAEKAQDPRRVGYALQKTAELLRETQRYEEAVEKVGRAIEILAEIEDQVGLALALKVRGQIAIDQHAYERAEKDLREAFRGLAGLKHTLEEIDVVLRLAQLSEARGDHASARLQVDELERRNLPSLRPDLVVEFERLKRDLAAPGDDGDPP